MGADLELLPALLVDVRGAQHGELLDTGRQRDRPANPCARPLRRRDDLARRLVEDAMVEGLQANADVLAFHDLSSLVVLPSPLLSLLLDDRCDDAGADRAATLADGKAQA